MMNDLELERWWKTPFKLAGPAVFQTPATAPAHLQPPVSQAHPVKSHPHPVVTLQIEQSAPPLESRQLELHLTVVLP